MQLVSPALNSQRILWRLHSAPRACQRDVDGQCGEGCNGQARAFDIFGAGARESERFEPFGESKPASVDDRFSGVEASIAEVGDAPGKLAMAGEAEERKSGLPERILWLVIRPFTRTVHRQQPIARLSVLHCYQSRFCCCG